MIRNWRHEDGQNAGENEIFARNVEKWVEHGATRLDLCFALIENDNVVGGIAFSSTESEAVYILDFSMSVNSFHLGAELIIRSIESLSLRKVCYHLYNDNDLYNQYRQCFLDAGFIAAQEKLSYRFTKETIESNESDIVYRSFAEVGEKVFIDAVAAVTRQTLDSVDSTAVSEHGETEVAETLIKDLKELDFQPDIWLLAYHNEKFIGLVIPTNFGDVRGTILGGINYIGVLPEERGKGYVDTLLIKGTQLLISQGVTTIIADIDVLNYPMKNALERNSYVFHCEEVILEKTC